MFEVKYKNKTTTTVYNIIKSEQGILFLLYLEKEKNIYKWEYVNANDCEPMASTMLFELQIIREMLFERQTK